jgi:Cys-tRNA(Pro)/Cys-tRNA(Cys) deacylase
MRITSTALIMNDELAAGVRRMLADANQRGLAVELRRRPAAHSLEEAAELLGIGPSDMAKTIVVRRSSREYLFALIPGGTQIAWPKLRSLLGVSKMKLPDAAEALKATGYERGTITPVGSEPSWPVIIDQRLVGRRVALGAGGHGYSAFVDIDDLVRAFNAMVADIADWRRSGGFRLTGLARPDA